MIVQSPLVILLRMIVLVQVDNTGGHITFIQGSAVDCGRYLPIPVALSSGEAESISAPMAHMRASHLRMLMYDLKFLCSESYDGDNMNYEAAKVIIDNEAVISIAKCNKDIAWNRHITRRFHFEREEKALNEHQFHWINTKYQVVDILTKVGSHSKIKPL